MAFKFTKCCELEDMGMCNGIEIPIIRHSSEDEHFEVIRFEDVTPIKEAVKRAEEFLSSPLTREDYRKAQELEDWWYSQSFEDYEGEVKGDLLGSLIFLEDVRLMENGIAILDLGS